ncbi:MAG: hypothetical protein Q7R50_05140, partial [Dehalococcoidales bacterium]|nr:hypothetical protein [Dehalococcoidales bacterium]
MRIIKTITVSLIGASLFLSACGGPLDGPPQATTPAVNSTPAMDMAPAAFTTSNLTVTPDKA